MEEQDIVPFDQGVSKTCSVATLGVCVVGVQVEAQVSGALRRFSLVGLPDGVLREARDRVRCAIENSGLSFPHREVIVSLGPAALPKFGSGFDLAIAVSILIADKQLNVPGLDRCLFLGELSLDGSVKHVPGVLAACTFAKERGFRSVIVPQENTEEASLVSDVRVFSVKHLRECIAFLRGDTALEQVSPRIFSIREYVGPTFGEVVGQYAAKRAAEIVAAGGHNLLMVGPPGSGKSMLASRLPSIIPPLTGPEVIDVARVYSIVRSDPTIGTIGRRLDKILFGERPFRAPHHSISTAGLIGGGSEPGPGEISLAHRGVLFLDEFPEFKRDALEALRQPMESGSIVLSRARLKITFPASFLLIAAMNPCPCGRRGLGRSDCECSPGQLQRYRAKVSGPLLDRIDLQIWVPPVQLPQFHQREQIDPTQDMRHRVLEARVRQEQRFGTTERINAHMTANEVKKFCALDANSMKLVERAAETMRLSARAYSRVLKVARTIADLAGARDLSDEHLAEALTYRLSKEYS